MSSLSRKTFAASTDQKIEWAVNLYRQWRFSRLTNSAPEMHIQEADICGLNLSKKALCYSLCAFVNEIKRQDGNDFGGKGLYNLVVLIQFHLEKRGWMWHLLDDDEFVKLCFTVDNLMKMRCVDRVSVTKSATPISVTDEELMWQKGILGEDSPVKLRNTVLYLLGLTCALRGGAEHCALRCPGFDSQLSVQFNTGTGNKVLVYKEDDRSKTNQGGLSGCRHIPKCVHVPQSENYARDIVHLYEKYVGLLPTPTKVSALYRYPLCENSLRPNQWYTEKPLGINCQKDREGDDEAGWSNWAFHES